MPTCRASIKIIEAVHATLIDRQASVPLIAPTPLLIVHGDRDPYFPIDHPRVLAAAGDAELWLEPGMGHAENAADEELLARLADWLIRA